MNDAQLVEAFDRVEPDSEALRALIDKLEFNTLERDFGAALKSRPRVQNSFDYRAVLRTDFPAWLNSLKQQVEFSFDLETTGLDSFTASIVGLSFCWDNHQAWYLPSGTPLWVIRRCHGPRSIGFGATT